MKINFGCGEHKLPGFIGVDKVKTKAADVIHDMNCMPYPFADDSVDEILMSHILEHLPDTISVMEEIWRISKNNARITIIVPYYNSVGAFQDPTHVRFFTERTFDYFSLDNDSEFSKWNYYSKARFKIISVNPVQKKILSFLPRRIQWFLAHHFSTIHHLKYELQVLK